MSVINEGDKRHWSSLYGIRRNCFQFNELSNKVDSVTQVKLCINGIVLTTCQLSELATKLIAGIGNVEVFRE